ncbi:MAG: DUF4404 family protein [Planctomycetales bacterium]|nr:DUF4404 family protein [Planctomycetales bacterium]
MPQRIETLRDAVKDLERELASLDNVDDETRQLLEEAAAEIAGALHPQDIEHQTLIERFEDAQQSYSAAHPAAATMLGRVVDALRQLGI